MLTVPERRVVVAGPAPVASWGGAVAAARTAAGLPAGEPFALLLAVDAARADDAVLDGLVDGWLRGGVFLVANWGPGCERLPDRVDGAAVEMDIDEPDTSGGTVLTTWHDCETATEALLSITGLSACEDRPDGRLLLVLVDDRVDVGDLMDSALDEGATSIDFSWQGSWFVREDTWWRDPVPGTEGLDEAALLTVLLGDDEYAAGTAESALGRRLDHASLAFATDLLRDPAPGRRALGASLLCTSYEVARATGHRVPPAVLDAVLTALRTETDPDALSVQVIALCRSGDPRALPDLVPLADHPDPGVRETLATCLPEIGAEPTAVAALRHLLDDPDADVRDWTTFAFTNLGDAAQVAATRAPDLLDRLLELATAEPRPATRYQAIAALAARGDRRVVPVMAAERLVRLSDDDAEQVELSLLDEADALLARPPGTRS